MSFMIFFVKTVISMFMKHIWLERKPVDCLLHIKFQNTIINVNYLALVEIMHILRMYMMAINYSLATYIAKKNE